MTEPMSTAQVVAGQIEQLRSQLTEIQTEIVAQLSHRGPFNSFGASQAGLAKQVTTSANRIRNVRNQVHEVWDDAAGETYGTAVDRSSRSMEAFASAIQGANPALIMQSAVERITQDDISIAELVRSFEQQAAQLLAQAKQPGAQINLAPLVEIVRDAENIRQGLDTFLHQVAGDLNKIAANMPEWAGPEGGGNPATSTRVNGPSTTSAPSGPTSANPTDITGISQTPQQTDSHLVQQQTVPIDGQTAKVEGTTAPIDGGVPNGVTDGMGAVDTFGAGMDPALATGADGLGSDGLGGVDGAENGALMPVRPVPGAIPGLGNNRSITPGVGRNPFPGTLPDIARSLGDRNDIGGMGVPPALRGADGGGGGIGGIGDVPGVHGPPTLQAADVPADPELPGVAQLAGGSESPHDPSGVFGAPGDAGPPDQQAMPPMIPPMGGMGGAGAMGSALAGNGAGQPGDGTGEGSPHRRRPVKNVPGVPQRLRGRAGMLDSTPAFLASSARKAGEEPATSAAELLDEELWRVEDKPAAPKRRFGTG